MHELSPKAFAALRKITRDELGELSDDEIHKLGINLLQFVKLLAEGGEPHSKQEMDLTDIEKRAVAFISTHKEMKGRPPSVRELCKALAYKSSRSGVQILRKLKKKGVI
jgi:hypothetical protein